MREIKFRAWSNKYNHMFRVKEISQNRDGYTHGTVDEEFTDEHEPEWDSPFVWSGRVNFTTPPNGIPAALFQDPNDEPFYLMQYTDLKDKNGVEIYEGDVLHLDGYQDMRITFIEGRFVAVSVNKIQEINWSPSPLSSLIDINYEVIGNIHEHPHLLEVSTE